MLAYLIGMLIGEHQENKKYEAAKRKQAQIDMSKYQISQKDKDDVKLPDGFVRNKEAKNIINEQIAKCALTVKDAKVLFRELNVYEKDLVEYENNSSFAAIK